MVTFKKLINSKATMGILLMVAYLNATSQNTSFLNDYYNYGVFGQFTVEENGVVIKDNPNFNFGIESYITHHIGITYNVYQHKNWNFKTGLILKYKLIKERINYTKEQTGRLRDYNFTSTFDSASKMNAIPLIAEYIYPINARIKWVVAPSITVAYFTGQAGDSFTSFAIDQPNPPTIITYYDGYYNSPLFLSAEISTGLYILFKHFMLQPEFRYSKSFRDTFTGRFTVENFKTEPNNFNGSFSQPGDYWGLSLSIYLKKRGHN